MWVVIWALAILVPDAPLSFANSLGGKIALYSSGVANQYGFGIQSGLLQIYSDAINADIAFGYGGSGSFTERMRIKGNGNVGIGISNPSLPLSFPASLGEKYLCIQVLQAVLAWPYMEVNCVYIAIFQLAK
jgi:hypothetical protein